MYFSCICLFVLYMLVFVIFSSSWCRDLAAVCDCGTASLDFSINFCFSVAMATNQNEECAHICFHLVEDYSTNISKKNVLSKYLQ